MSVIMYGVPSIRTLTTTRPPRSRTVMATGTDAAARAASTNCCAWARLISTSVSVLHDEVGGALADGEAREVGVIGHARGEHARVGHEEVLGTEDLQLGVDN